MKRFLIFLLLGPFLGFTVFIIRDIAGGMIFGGPMGFLFGLPFAYWPETLSIVRIVVGLLFLEHGSAKLLGFPTPANPAPAMMTLLWTQGVIELAGGLLLAIGLFTRPVAFILAGDMAVAYFMGHAPKNFFPLLNGGDAAILYCFIFLLFFVAGPGRWSLDRNPVS
jgi:putative oxidoreductase